VCVEGVHIRRRGAGQFLDLAFAHPNSAGALDGGGRIGEAAADGLQGSQAPQAVGVGPLGQVPHHIGGIRVGASGSAVGQAIHRDLAGHTGQAAFVAFFHAPSAYAVGAGDRLVSVLAGRA
jgi:hypothetical protein